jgi:hypothetical protein
MPKGRYCPVCDWIHVGWPGFNTRHEVNLSVRCHAQICPESVPASHSTRPDCKDGHSPASNAEV